MYRHKPPLSHLNLSLSLCLSRYLRKEKIQIIDTSSTYTASKHDNIACVLVQSLFYFVPQEKAVNLTAKEYWLEIPQIQRHQQSARGRC